MILMDCEACLRGVGVMCPLDVFDSESGDSLSVNCGIIRPIIGIMRPGQRMVEGGVKVFRNSDIDIEVADRV